MGPAASRHCGGAAGFLRDLPPGGNLGRMQYARIIALCIAAACVYGIVQDQVTARICVEYFTIGHPPIFATESPTLLGLGWGILATWWVGAILGVALALCARAGRAPKLAAADLLRPVGLLMVAIALLALVGGIVGYLLARSGAIGLYGPLDAGVPADRQVAFLADLWAHCAAYLAGFVGGIVLCVRTARRRRR